MEDIMFDSPLDILRTHKIHALKMSEWTFRKTDMRAWPAVKRCLDDGILDPKGSKAEFTNG